MEDLELVLRVEGRVERNIRGISQESSVFRMQNRTNE